MSDTESSSEAPTLPREQRVWKKNVPFLYDTVITNELEWPSLTVQWMPDVSRPEGSEVSIHRLLYGTHTANNVQNHLMISKLLVPLDEAQFDESKWDMEREEFGGFGTGRPAKLEAEIRINHSGEVHRARYMPQNPIIIATRGPADDLYIFDYTKHPSEPHDKVFRPQLRLQGHDAEGYGMSWSNAKEGSLLSGADDKTICHWDINANQTTAGRIVPQTRFRGHTMHVEDVQFHELHPFTFASVSDDKTLKFWDLRHPEPQLSVVGHTREINCISFNPHSEYLLATGSADHTVALWDMRNLGRKMYTLTHHDDEVFQVAFSPHFESILASSGSDDQVIVWDISKISTSSTASESSASNPPQRAVRPPEVLFIHCGHDGKVADFSWNPNQPWTICSNDEFNKLQTWEVSASTLCPELSEAER